MLVQSSTESAQTTHATPCTLPQVYCVVTLSEAVAISIDPIFKMQGNPLQAGWSFGKSGMLHNSVQGEQITP